MELVAVDLGGTHVRFARGRVAGGRVVDLEAAITLRVASFPSLAAAWRHATENWDRVPDRAAIAVACPVGGEELRLTNNPWVVVPRLLPEQLACRDVLVINDFGAQAHAVAHMPPERLRRVAGPPPALPGAGIISVIGPGTGLGVAQLVLDGEGGYRVIETEGGHVGFAPADEVEDRLLADLRARLGGRVSAERVVSGAGLLALYETLVPPEARRFGAEETEALWQAALAGEEPQARRALAHFCACFGTIAGDIALAQGADMVVLAGGIPRRIGAALGELGFAARFVDKGRFRARMATLPVVAIDHPEPGLFGAAAAYALRAHLG